MWTVLPISIQITGLAALHLNKILFKTFMPVQVGFSLYNFTKTPIPKPDDQSNRTIYTCCIQPVTQHITLGNCDYTDNRTKRLP